MTVKELRYLVDNLDEYIHVPGGIERLKKTVLHLAVSGQLVPQDPSDGTGEELYQEIQAEKAKLIAAGKLKKQKPLPAITEAEIPFAIPKTWKWVRLGEVFTFINGDRGKNYPSKDKLSVSGDIPFFSAINLENNEVASEKLLYLSRAQYDALGSGKVSLNDLIICIRGSLGKHAISNYDTGAIASSLVILRNQTSSQGLTNYVAMYLDSNLFSLEIKHYDNGTAQPNLSADNLKKFLLPLPPKAEQKRLQNKIGIIFKLIDELSEKYRAEQAERGKLVASSLAQLARGNGDLALTHLNEIIRTKADAAQLRKTILHLAVSGQLVPQDPSEGTGEELFQQIQAEKAKLIAAGKLKKQKPLPGITKAEIPFAIPKTWKWVRLGDVLCKLTDGSHNPPKGVESGLPMLSSRNVTDAGLDFENIRLLTPQDFEKENKRTRIEPGDILLTIVGSIGRAYVIDEQDKQFTLQRSVAVLTPLLLSARYLSGVVFGSLYFQAVLENEATGTAQRGVYLNQIKQIIVPLPPLAEQTRIVQKTTQLLDLIAKLEPHLEK